MKGLVTTGAAATLVLTVLGPGAVVRVCADSALSSPLTKNNDQGPTPFESSPREQATSRQLRSCNRDDALDPTRVRKAVANVLY